MQDHSAPYYRFLRPEIVGRVPGWARTVLDVGCASGRLGAYLKASRPGRYVAGVEVVPEVAAEAAQVLDRVYVGDIASLGIEAPPGGFDAIICADVLEHLPDPWRVLKKLSSLLSRRGVVILSLPNFRNVLEIAGVIRGSWDYQSAGIFDHSHLRFFTPARARQLVEAAGLRVRELYLKPDPRLSIPQDDAKLPRNLDVGNIRLQQVTPAELEELTAYQIILVASHDRWCQTPDQVSPGPEPTGEAAGPQVSIVLWWPYPARDPAELRSRLRAVWDSLSPDVSCEILVAADGVAEVYPSSGASLGFAGLESELASVPASPPTRIIQCQTGAGFYAAVNAAAEHARGEYLALLRPDVVLQPGWLKSLLSAAKPEDVGAVGAQLADQTGKSIPSVAAVFSDGSLRYGIPGPPRPERPSGNPAPEIGPFIEPFDVDCCASTVLLVKTLAFWNAGGFDPRFDAALDVLSGTQGDGGGHCTSPVTYADADFAFSLRRYGWRVCQIPSAVAVCSAPRPADTGSGAVTSMARRDGGDVRSSQRTLFAEKWRGALALQDPPAGAEVPGRMHRLPALRVLFVSSQPPAYDQNSAGRRAYHLMRLAAEDGHNVSFFCISTHPVANPYLDTLARSGVSVFQGPPQGRLLPLLTSLQPDIVWLLNGPSDSPQSETLEQCAALVRQWVPKACLISDRAMPGTPEVATAGTATPADQGAPLAVLRRAVRHAFRQALFDLRAASPPATRDPVEGRLTSIVIPCWNQVDLTRQCIESIFRGTAEPFELVLIDNGSTDGTAQYLAQLSAQRRNVSVITNPVNTGYGYACNEGMAAAKGEFIVLMNNDVVVPPGWLGRLLRAARNPEVGIVGPVTNAISGIQRVDVPYGGNLSWMEAYARTRARESAHKGFYCPRAVGFCMLVKREVIDKIGGFDTAFGIGNFEDDDFCVRAQLAGYRVWIAEDAFVHHFGSQTFSRSNINYRRLMERNFAVLRAKWSIPATYTLEHGIPYAFMLANSFDPRWHRCPLTPEEVAASDVPPLPLAATRTTRLLMAPDWTDPKDRWLQALAIFLQTFAPEEDVALLLRVDPLIEPDVAGVIDHITAAAQHEGLDLNQGHEIVVVNDRVAPTERASVYRAAHFFVDTAPAGSFRANAQEAAACGLRLVEPAWQALATVRAGLNASV
ncbi:MAG: glycosyltransferase [Firmicutes bacterium]|nr:glycosyltransferase [Bacillota bacterium]